MKQYLPIIFSLAFSVGAVAQDTTRVQRDSVKEQRIQYTPYYSQSMLASGSYVKAVSDSNLFKLAAGVNVFNVLRGQVPGLVMPYDQRNASASGFRSYYLTSFREAAVVIDGVPYNSLAGNYFNLNAFDFASITTVSSANALNYQNGGNAGAFLLTSKTGEGITKPRIEFNSYTTLFSETQNNIRGSKTASTSWNLSNSIAYSQDFGKIDLRVSYNFFERPKWGSTPYQKEPAFHNLKINTGVNLTERLSLRLILDNRYGNADFDYTTLSQRGFRNFLNTNFTIKYKLSNWLNLTSQTVYSKADSIIKHIYPPGSIFQGTYQRNTHSDKQTTNLFANAGGSIGSSWSWSAFVGAQYTQQNYSSYKYSNSKYDVKLPVASMGGNIALKKFVNLALLYKLSKYSLKSYAQEYTKSNYTVSGSFLLSELMKLNNISLVKLRSSFTSGYSMNFASYPWTWSIIDWQYRKPYQVNSLEMGSDFVITKPNIAVSINYFCIKENYLPSQNFSNSLKNIFRKGWEANIRYDVVKGKRLSYQTALMLSTYQYKWIFIPQQASDVTYSHLAWRNLFYNQVNINRIIFKAVLEHVDSDFGLKSSFVKLREISAGYLIQMEDRHVVVKNALISVTGWNLCKLAGSGTDYEVTYLNAGSVKSTSLNISLTF